MLTLVFILSLQPTTFAKISKTSSKYSFTLDSDYILDVPYKDTSYKFILALSHAKVKGIMLVDSSQNYNFSIAIDNENNKTLPFLFSFKNPTKIILTKSNISETFIVKKGDSIISDSEIYVEIKKSSREMFRNLTGVQLVIPTTDGSFATIDLPKEFVDEWNYVMSADLKELEANM